MRRDWRAIKMLVVAQLVTFIIAVSAGFLALAADEHRIADLAVEAHALRVNRIAGRYQQCELLRALVLAASTRQTRSGVAAYIARTPLVNCVHYSMEGPRDERRTPPR